MTWAVFEVTCCNINVITHNGNTHTGYMSTHLSIHLMPMPNQTPSWVFESLHQVESSPCLESFNVFGPGNVFGSSHISILISATQLPSSYVLRVIDWIWSAEAHSTPSYFTAGLPKCGGDQCTTVVRQVMRGIALHVSAFGTPVLIKWRIDILTWSRIGLLICTRNMVHRCDCPEAVALL